MLGAVSQHNEFDLTYGSARRARRGHVPSEDEQCACAQRALSLFASEASRKDNSVKHVLARTKNKNRETGAAGRSLHVGVHRRRIL